MKVAALDLGTNSFLCLICEISGGDEHGKMAGIGKSKSLTVYDDLCRVVRLGEKVNENRRFLPEALARAEVVLKEFSEVIKHHGAEVVVATATSAARDVSNGQELIALGEKYGIPISIIKGKREAELSFEGAVSSISSYGLNASQNRLHSSNILVVDVGGGSTEMIFRKAGSSEIVAESFNVGCVRLTEMFLTKDPVDKAEYEALSKYAESALAKFGMTSPDIILAVAGTPTTLACVDQGIDFEYEKVENKILTSKKIAELTATLGAMSLAERKNVKGLEPLRADVIIAGGALLLAALATTNREELVVSTRGLRYGVALHYQEFQK